MSAGSFPCCRLQLDCFHVTPFQVLFQGVLQSLAQTPLASFARHQLQKKQKAWHAEFLYPEDMSRSTELGFEERNCFNALCLSSIQDVKIGQLALPVDVKDGMEGRIMKMLQLLNVQEIECPGLTSIQKTCENNAIVDLELLVGQSDVVLVEHPSAKPSKCLACIC